MKKQFFLFIFSLFVFSVQGQLTPEINKKGKYGFVDGTGEFVIKAEFDNVGSFSNGMAWVLKGDKYGFINRSGKYIIKPKYSSIETFNDLDLCKISIGGSIDKSSGMLKGAKYGFIDMKGEEVIAPKYTFISDFDKNGVCFVNLGGSYDKKTGELKGGNYGYILSSGVPITKIEFTDIQSTFHNGFAWVKKKKKYGYINDKGRFITKIKYDAVQDTFHNEIAWVMVKDKYGYVNNKGRELGKIKYDDVGRFEDGLGLIAIKAKKKGFQYGYMNTEGNEVIKPVYDDAHASFKNDRAAVKKEEKWAILNTKGEFLTDFEYTGITPFNNGVASVTKTGGVFYDIPVGAPWGLVDIDGKPLTPIHYSMIREFTEEGLALVSKGSIFEADTIKLSLIEKNSAEELKKTGIKEWSIKQKTIRTQQIKEANETEATYRKNLSDKETGFGWIDTEGKEVIPIMYKKALEFSEGLAPVSDDDGHYVYINTKNEVALKTNYTNVTGFRYRVAGVYDNDTKKWGGIDLNGELVIPFFSDEYETVREVVAQLYLPERKKLDKRQVTLFSLYRYRKQDNYRVTDIIPDSMWDF